MLRALVIALLAAGGLAVVPAGWGAEVPNLERGRALYENHCVVCHTAKVHRRVPPLPLGIDDLRYIVTLWASQQGLRWDREDIEDVVHYLDRTHYRFEK
ncbi:MAG TPA: cytochrome c [Burkholderiales bacterium]